MSEFKILILKNKKTSWHNINANNRSEAVVKIKNKFGKGIKILQVDETDIENKSVFENLDRQEKAVIGHKKLW